MWSSTQRRRPRGLRAPTAGLAAALACAAILAAGCGKAPGVAVSGTVQFEGKPVADGMIQFVPQAGTDGPTAGAPIKEGRYDIAAVGGPVPGKYRVEVSSFEEVRKATEKDMAGGMFGRSPSEFGAAAGTEPQVVRKNVIPAKFNESSELTADIPDASSHEANFDLK
ncbi:MAG: hypothetical protein K2X91_08715 [Thermoleophilia bacterium]|nr:hypothetical protein [Thermoleophilia bacterium]